MYQGLQPDNNPVCVSTSLVIICRALFTNSNYVFRKQEWFSLGRDDVLRFVIDWALG
jgi:hypothetical protein